MLLSDLTESSKGIGLYWILSARATEISQEIISEGAMKLRIAWTHRRIAERAFDAVQCRCDEAGIFIVLLAFLAGVKQRVTNHQLRTIGTHQSKPLQSTNKLGLAKRLISTTWLTSKTNA